MPIAAAISRQLIWFDFSVFPFCVCACVEIVNREWLTPNALQQSIAIQNQERDSDTSPLWDSANNAS